MRLGWRVVLRSAAICTLATRKYRELMSAWSNSQPKGRSFKSSPRFALEKIYGYIYDVKTGKLEEVSAAMAAGKAM